MAQIVAIADLVRIFGRTLCVDDVSHRGGVQTMRKAAGSHAKCRRPVMNPESYLDFDFAKIEEKLGQVVRPFPDVLDWPSLNTRAAVFRFGGLKVGVIVIFNSNR